MIALKTIRFFVAFILCADSTTARAVQQLFYKSEKKPKTFFLRES